MGPRAGLPGERPRPHLPRGGRGLRGGALTVRRAAVRAGGPGRRPALILPRQSKLHLLTWITVAPITTTIRGITSEVPVGRRNGLDHDGVVSCDNITTVRTNAVGGTIGLFFDDQEPTLALAISDAFDLFLP